MIGVTVKVFGVMLFKIFQPERDQRNRLKLSTPTVRDIAMSPDARKSI